MSAESKGSLHDRRVGLKSYLPFIRKLSSQAKNTNYEARLKKIAVLIETGVHLDANKITAIENAITKLKENLPNQKPTPVPVPIKVEIPYAPEPPLPKPVEQSSVSVPVEPALSSNRDPVSDVLAAIVKREPTPDPKFHQNHIETDDEDSASEEIPTASKQAPTATSAEVAKADVPKTPKRRRPPGPKKSKVKTKEIQNEPQKKVRKLNEWVDQPAPQDQFATPLKSTVVVEVPAPSPDLKITKSAERKTYPAKKQKSSIGPLKTKRSKRSAGGKTGDRAEAAEAAPSALATKAAGNVSQQPTEKTPQEITNEQPNTDDDNKVNELKNLLTNITKGEAKDPKLLDSFKNILGDDGFAKLKSLFVENASSAEFKAEEKSQVGEAKPLEPTKADSKPRRSDSPLKMPPVSGNHPRGKKKSEVDRLNQDIMDCFIRDGILSAHGLRTVNKVKYEEVVAMEDYELDAGSCSDTDTEEPLVNIQNKARATVITRAPSTSHESTPEPLPATKSLFIFDQKAELFGDTMEYRLLSGKTGQFEVHEELKESFLKFINKHKASSSTANVETNDCDQKPPIFPLMNDVVFDPMEVITIEDDDIALPPVAQPPTTQMEANFEIITVDDDDSNDASTRCPILEAAMNQRNRGAPSTSSQNGSTTAISQNGSTISRQSGHTSLTSNQNGSISQQSEQEDLIYKQVKEFAPQAAANVPSKVMYRPEQTVFNLSFYEDLLLDAVIMRCRAEKCFYEIRDKGLFQYHVQTRHCLAKWDGSCKLCKGSVYHYGTLLDEYKHMERYHMSKLKPKEQKIFLIPENFPAQTSSTASSLAVGTPPQPSPNQQQQQQQQQQNVPQTANRPFICRVITPSEFRTVLARPSINSTKTLINPTTTPINPTLRLRLLPGDKLSGGNNSSIQRSDGSTESPVKNTVQVSSTYTPPTAPKPGESPLSTAAPAQPVYTSPSVSAPTRGLIGVNPPANNYISILQPAQLMQPTLRPAPVPPQAQPGVRPLGLPPLVPSAVPLSVSTSSVVHPTPNPSHPGPMIVSVMSAAQTQLSMAQPPPSVAQPPNSMAQPAQPQRFIQATVVGSTNPVRPTRVLRPWLDDDDMKSPTCINNMTKVECLRNLYKCMATACYFSTNDSAKFGQHLAIHSRLNVQCQIREYARCAYCLFKAGTITDLVQHVMVEHEFDVYGCTQCFYRAIAPDTVRDHEKMFHLYTGIQIRSNHATNALIPYRDAVTAAKEGRRNFVPMISCAACHVKFHHYELYREHLRSDHNSENTQFRCNKCKELTNSDDIQVHLENCHKIMKFHCLQCPLGYNNMNDLRKHLTNCHPNKLPFFCERSIEKCNFDVPQSSPESVVIQFWGDIMRHVKMINANAAQAGARQ